MINWILSTTKSFWWEKKNLNYFNSQCGWIKSVNYLNCHFIWPPYLKPLNCELILQNLPDSLNSTMTITDHLLRMYHHIQYKVCLTQ